MPRRRLTLAEAKLSGAFAHNKKRYRHLLDAAAPQSDAQTMRSQWRAPKHFSTDEKTAFREILSTLPALVHDDRLLIEVCSQLLAKQKAGTAKASESNRLLSTLEKLQNRAERAARAAPVAAPQVNTSKDDGMEDYFREEDESQALEERIRAEMERRRNISPPAHLFGTEAAQWSWYSTVANDLDPDRKVN